MPILREVEHLDPDPIQRARTTWIEELVQTRPLGDAPRAASLIAAAEQAGQAGDRDLQLDLAWLVASRAWLVDPAPTARRVLIEAADRLGDPGISRPPDPGHPGLCRPVRKGTSDTRASP
jgi:hypothetical protein